MRGFGGIVLFMCLCLLGPFQARADDVFYCYEDFYWDSSMGDFYWSSYLLNREDRKAIVRYSVHADYFDYSVAFNLTEKKIGYIDHGSDRERWVDITNMESQGNLLVLTSSMVEFSEIPPVIGIIYFNRETRNYTEIWRGFHQAESSAPIPLTFEVGAGRCQTEEMQ